MAADESVMELSPDDTMALVEPPQVPRLVQSLAQSGILHSSAGYSETRLFGSVPRSISLSTTWETS